MATNNLDIIVRVKDDGTSKLTNTAKALDNVGDAATRASNKARAAGSGFTEMANRIDSTGRNARIGLSSLGQAADLVGVNLSGVIGPAAGAADAIGDIVGALGALGLAGGVLGGIVVALGLVKQNYDQMIAQRAKAITQADPWIQALTRERQVTEEVAAAVQKYAEAQARAEASQGRGGGRAADAMAQSARYMREEVDRASDALWRLAAAAGAAGEELSILKGEANGVVGQTYAEIEAQRQYNVYLNNFTDIQDEALAGMVAVREEGSKKSDPKILEDYKLRTNALQRLGNTASQAASKLRGLIEGALNPTSVEERLGMVGDAWDELRLRLEAVATGTDPSQYGAGFQAQLAELEAMGYTAETAAKAMKDFSFYADPANIKFADFGPLTAQIEQQLLGLAGKANLTAAAMEDVWEHLSPQAQAALAEQGINSATDAIDALADPTQQAKTQVQGLNDALGAIPRAITTTFTVIKDAAETAITEFRAVLDKFIADYGNVVISINAETTAVPPGTNTPAPPPAGPPSGNYARGLDFIVPPGFPNDSYSFRGNLTSGERVTVTPQGSAAAPNIIVYVMDENGNARRARKVRALAAMGA